MEAVLVCVIFEQLKNGPFPQIPKRTMDCNRNIDGEQDILVPIMRAKYKLSKYEFDAHE